VSAVGSELPPNARLLWLGAGVAALLAIAVRVNNALYYNLFWGFDALYNWRYIQLLKKSWALPAPDLSWSTAHPPLFYYVGGAVCRLLPPMSVYAQVVVLRLLVAAAGLSMAWLAVVLVRRLDPGNERRAVLTLGLVLFLPVHLYMSAMLSEEIVVAAVTSGVLVSAGSRLATGRELTNSPALWLGLAAGAAFLTKLTGVLVIGAAAFAFLLDGWRRRELAPSLPPILVLVCVASVAGGWFYVRNLIGWGYLYPHGLEVHRIMFTMPPGDRELLDYVRIPLATFTDPQVLNPDLLRSIWGSTYLTVWFDGHRTFLPTDMPLVSRLGTWILVLALLPSVACAVGLARGVGGAIRSRIGPDTLFVSMVALTLAGYVAFTWRNPWFVTSKGSFLLGLTVPFAYYASEVLDDWMGRGRALRIGIWVVLLALAGLVLFTFTFSDVFWDTYHMKNPGVVW
jgi:hypothetical protein